MDSSIKAYFGGDTSGLRAAIADAGTQVSNFAGQIAKKFEGRDLARGLATALGLSVQSIAEKFARLITGMSKDVERLYGELASLSDREAELSKKNMRARLRDEDLLKLAINERDGLQRKIDNNAGMTLQDMVRLKKDRIAQEETIASIMELQTKIQKAQNDDEEQFQKVIDAGTKSWDAVEKKRAEERKRRAEDLNKAVQDGLEKSADLSEREFEAKLKTMSADERINALEHERRELIEVQKTAIKGSNDYRELGLKIGEVGNRIEEERAASTVKTLKGEEKITDEIKKQLAAKNAQISIAGIRGGNQFNEASPEALAEIVRRNRNRAQQIRGGSGGFGIGQDLEAARLEAEAMNAEKELAYRRNFIQGVNVGGVDRARETFAGDPLQFDRVLQQLTTGLGNSDKLLTELEKTNELLAGKFINQ